LPVSARLLLEAADRRERHGEDRLTEIFATVLRGEPRLMAWLAGEAFRDPALASVVWEQRHYAVSTQVWLSPKARPDMLVEVGHPAARGRVICEHKSDAAVPLTDAERVEYARHAGDQPLIAIVPTAWRPKLPKQYLRLTWHQVAQAADAIGRRHAGRGWRRDAETPAAAAGQRLLHELISYLERHAVDDPIIEPLSQLDLVAFQRAKASLDAIRTLFEGIARHRSLAGDEGDAIEISSRRPGTRTSPGVDSWYATYERDWAALGPGHGGWAELLVDRTDPWRSPERRLDEPALGVGYSFELRAGRGWPSPLEPGSRWAAQLWSEHEIEVVAESETRGRVFRTIYLAEVMAHGADLADQVRWGATRAAAALALITSQRPPE
jgi:hypothetical protein